MDESPARETICTGPGSEIEPAAEAEADSELEAEGESAKGNDEAMMIKRQKEDGRKPIEKGSEASGRDFG